MTDVECKPNDPTSWPSAYVTSDFARQLERENAVMRQAVASESLLAIGDKLRTQDNRMTRDPMFCVQVCERYGPIMPEYGSGELMFHDHHETETYYKNGFDPEKWKELKELYDMGDLPENITAASYVEKWITVQVCFTEDGCKRHLELNGHNYRHHHGTRIYAESFHRNPEMLEIRAALLANAEVSDR